MRVFTKSGLQIANDFERIVHGGRGDYIEISQHQIIGLNIYMPLSEKWRMHYGMAYYLEFRSDDISNIKIYHQMRTVDYADYKIGYFYVSPEDVVLKE